MTAFRDMKDNIHLQDLNDNAISDDEAIVHLKRSIAEGEKNWYICLLEAIALWTPSEEKYAGRHFKYLIAGEAFDWRLLTERLCIELEGIVPEDERVNLMFGTPPIDLSEEELRAIIGTKKYQAHLNYFYGILVEQMLHVVVQLDIDKAKQGDIRRGQAREDVLTRIYGVSEEALMQQFKEGKDLPRGEVLTLTEFKEFTYWLFKYRVAHCDSSRLASDTKKALKYLAEMQADRG